MKQINYIFIISSLIVISSLVGVQNANAHVPLEVGDGESLDTAVFIPEVSKSWVIYNELHDGGDAHYYQFMIGTGERIRLSLFVPPGLQRSGFLPGIVLMGPELKSNGNFPDFIETTEETGAQVYLGRLPERATFEPFSPSAFYNLIDVDVLAPETGTYYIAVYEPNQGGNYGIAIGYVESFTLSEWIFVPVSLISIYQWEGQSLALIFAPYAFTFVLGFALNQMRRTSRTPLNVPNILGTITGLLFLGSGISFGFQILLKIFIAPSLASLISIIFTIIPLLLGVATLRLINRDHWQKQTKSLLKLIAIGIIAIFTWTGLYIGPILAIVAAVIAKIRIMIPNKISSKVV